MCTDTCMHTHVLTCGLAQVHTHTGMHTCVHRHIHRHTHAHTLVQAHTFMCTHVCSYTVLQGPVGERKFVV
jgi:hypothetical protein